MFIMGLVSYVLTYGAAVLGLVIVAAYFFFTRKFNHWKKKGVRYLKPLPFVGNLKDVAFMKKNIGMVAKDIYEEHKKEPFIGLYAFDEPVLQIHDLQMVKAVLVKDFQYFCDRSLHADERLDPLAARSLFGLTGDKWKRARNAVTPSFTSGKMKRMYELVAECGRLLVKALEKDIQKGTTIPVNELAARYTTDVIASCAFGIQGHTLENPEAEFRRILRLSFEFSPLEALIFAASFLAPNLVALFGLKIIKPEVEKFVISTISSTIKEREAQQIKRNDLLDSLIQLKNSGKILDEEGDDSTQPASLQNFDELDLAGHSLAFLNAGFETSATTMSYALYELSMHSDVQEKLRLAVRDAAVNGMLTYETVLGLKYLDMVVQETLRKYPPLAFIDRVSNKPYTLPGTTLTLETGSRIMIPAHGFHMDPEFYPNPKNFDPERFSEENKKKIVHYTHMPFGEGPRNCVGMRFALMQTKTALANILLKYSVHPCSKTPKEITFNPKSFLLQPKDNIELVFRSL